MILVTISDIPKFMSMLFSSEVFDKLYVSEVDIKTFVNYKVDGYLNKEFLDETEAIEKYVRWGRLRPICRELIKGKRTPLSMKFSYVLPEAEKETVLKAHDYAGDCSLVHLIINVVFEENKLSILSATSTDTFILDKSHDGIWDITLEQYLKKMNIDYEREV